MMEYSWKPKSEVGIPYYIQIADHLKKLIGSGFYKPGDKISEREIAAQFKVSRNTATRAFDIMRDYGFVESFEKSATVISKNAANLARGIADWDKFLLHSGQKDGSAPEKRLFQQNLDDDSSSLNMWSANNSDFGTLEIVHEVFRRVALDDIEHLFYAQSAQGLPELRREILGMVKQYGISASVENIFTFVGYMEAMSCLAAAIFSANTVIFHAEHDMIEGYSYFSYTPVSLCAIRTDEEGVIPGDFIRQLKRHAGKDRILYLQPINHIPTGLTMTARRMAELLAVCRNENIPIIENDILRDITSFDPPKPLRSMNSDLVIYLAAPGIFSEVGIKAGWLIVPEKLRYKFTETKMHMYGGNHTYEIVAYELFKHGYYAEVVKRLRNICIARNDVINAELHKYLGGYARWNDTESVYRLVTFNEGVCMNEYALRESQIFNYTNMFSLSQSVVLDLLSNYTEDIIDTIIFIRDNLKRQ
jgi:GntR family transcriptional regulator of abcA and norABC